MGTEGFRDQVVIITGASSGIGEALAYHLAQAGAFLALAARNAERLETVAAECRRLGAKAASVPTDVSDEGQCKALVASALTTYGRIDALVNNAGFGVGARFANLPSLALFVDVLNTNFLGSVYCTYYALPHLKQTGGRIVAVSSLAAKVPLPYYSSYTASKYAMAGFFDVIRMELEDSGVSVTTVYPDFVATRFAANVRDAGGRPRGQDARSYSRKTMTAQECARLIVEAAAVRRREVTLSTRGRFVPWIKLLAPGVVDKIAKKVVRKLPST
ncbi:MAG: SDR family oxidoreductase [Candidatus Deferrimicrobium sp.]